MISEIENIHKITINCPPFSSPCQFVRCIRSNSDKTKWKWDEPTIARQLRAYALTETLEFRTKGYPVKMPIATFVAKLVKDYWYSIAIPDTMQNATQIIHSVLHAILEMSKFDCRRVYPWLQSTHRFLGYVSLWISIFNSWVNSFEWQAISITNESRPSLLMGHGNIIAKNPQREHFSLVPMRCPLSTKTYDQATTI